MTISKRGIKHVQRLTDHTIPLNSQHQTSYCSVHQTESQKPTLHVRFMLEVLVFTTTLSWVSFHKTFRKSNPLILNKLKWNKLIKNNRNWH